MFDSLSLFAMSPEAQADPVGPVSRTGSRRGRPAPVPAVHLDPLGVIGAVDARLARFEQRLARIEQALDGLLAALRPAPSADAEFNDIDLDRHYTVAELAAVVGRECSTQAIYRAMNTGRLVETVSAGVRGTLGRHYVAFLRAKKDRRCGSRANRASDR